jgi:hypothetical protein
MIVTENGPQLHVDKKSSTSVFRNDTKSSLCIQHRLNPTFDGYYNSVYGNRKKSM